MSKLRQEVTEVDGDLATPPEGDLKAYVIFTQLKQDAPHVHAGWVDAADDAMALQFACEHYGQDQECVNIWAIGRSALAGTEKEYPTSRENGPTRVFEVFVQKRSGDQYRHAGSVEAPHSEAALEEAMKQHSGDGIWVVSRDKIIATAEGDVIWRFTSQDYRMARGYSAAVREKWQKIRAEPDIEEYEKDDLKEMF